MTFLEICQAVLLEMDADHQELKSVSGSVTLSLEVRRAVRCVQRQYLRVLRWSRWWDFLHQRGTLFTTVAGQAKYTVPGIRRVLPNSWQLDQGNATNIWLTERPYSDWLSSYSVQAAVKGVPTLVFQTPEKAFRLHPIPTDVWNIVADWYIEPPKLVNDNDEPVWETEYHELLVWLAALDWAENYEKTESLPMIHREARAAWAAFLERYTPVSTGASALI